MTAVGFNFPTIDARSSPIFQISGSNSIGDFEVLRAHHFVQRNWRALFKVNIRIQFKVNILGPIAETQFSHCLKVRLHTTINRADFVSWCMLYTYEGNTNSIEQLYPPLFTLSEHLESCL